MGATVAILLLWLGFGGSHIMLSNLPIRTPLIARMGETVFRAFYSVVALALFIPLVRIYLANRHAGAWLWTPLHGPAWLWLMYLGMTLAFVLLIAGLARPGPGSLVPGPATPQGVHRITRHPMLMSFLLFGVLHLLSNSSTADVVFFGGFVVFALIAGRHQDQRKLATGAPGFREFYESTPFLPLTGGQTLQGIRELSPILVAVAIVITIVARHLHPG